MEEAGVGMCVWVVIECKFYAKSRLRLTDGLLMSWVDWIKNSIRRAGGHESSGEPAQDWSERHDLSKAPEGLRLAFEFVLVIFLVACGPALHLYCLRG